MRLGRFGRPESWSSTPCARLPSNGSVQGGRNGGIGLSNLSIEDCKLKVSARSPADDAKLPTKQAVLTRSLVAQRYRNILKDCHFAQRCRLPVARGAEN